VAFRIVWGLVGTRHARFSSFLRGPAAVAAYLRSVVGGRPLHHAGHNPAGALAIVALLGLAAVVTAAGWASYNETGGEWLKDLHEGAANVMLAVVGIHIAGVLVGSWLHRDNLIAAMVTGRKLGRPEDAVRSAWRSVAALMLVAVAGLWTLQWHNAPQAAAAAADAAALPTAVSTAGRPQTRDDD
jgi:cytochrome b